MHRDREIRKSDGTLMHLEKPDFGVLIRDGKVVNEEGYNLFLEREKQNKLAPVTTSPELAEATRKATEDLQGKKYEELEKKVDSMSDTLSAILNKLNEKS